MHLWICVWMCMRRVLWMVLGSHLRGRGCFKLGDMRRYYFVLPFLLQVGEDILVHAILVKLGLNGCDDIVYD